MIEVSRTDTGLSFPAFEGGSRLTELVQALAKALGTRAQKSQGSPLEVLIGFDGYPDGFALWWDGYTCELGYVGSDEVDLDAVEIQLTSSGMFQRSRP